MPNKYSHSVVLAHYSSLGLIDLPNDQYIAYIKTQPGSRRPSTLSRSRLPVTSAQGSVTSSSGYSNRYRIVDDDCIVSWSATNGGEYGRSTKRDIIIDPDGGSGDEGVVLHKRHDQIDPAARSQKGLNGHGSRTQKVTRTGTSSSEASVGVTPLHVRRRAYHPVRCESKTSQANIINLNDYEAVPAPQVSDSAPTRSPVLHAAPSSGPKTKSITSQARSVHGKIMSSVTGESEIDKSDFPSEPTFDDFSDNHFPGEIMSGKPPAESIPDPASLKSRSATTCTSNLRITPASAVSAPLPKRVDSANDMSSNPLKLKQKQPGGNGSFESIPSINPDDLVQSTRGRPLPDPLKSQKSLSAKAGDHKLTSVHPEAHKDTIDPNLFEVSVGGRHPSSPSRAATRLPPLRLGPPLSNQRPPQPYSRKNSDHAATNPDFWRELEEMLSDSDASVVFPPDVVKHKARDGNIKPPKETEDKSKNGTEGGELKRPITAPSPGTSSVPERNEDMPLAEGRRGSAATANNRELGEPRDAQDPTTAQRMDIPGQEKGRKGILKRLRKKSTNDPRP